MMSRTAFVTGLALAAALPAQAADRLSYSYLDAQYVGGDLEPKDGDSIDTRQGFELGVGAALMPWVTFVGEYRETRYDPTPGERETDGDDFEHAFSSAGFGVHSLKRAYQIQLETTYERIDYDFRTRATPASPLVNRDEKVEGYGVLLGVRVPLPSFELHASYKYFDYNDEGSGQAGDGADGEAHIGDGGRARAGFLVQLTPYFAFTADYTLTSFDELDYNEWSAGFRRYFATASERRARTGGIFGGTGGESDAAE